MWQNLAVAYNAIAVPIGFVGLAGLLIGALAKHGASLLVTLNAWDHGRG
jgi:cation transport ATPase